MFQNDSIVKCIITTRPAITRGTPSRGGECFCSLAKRDTADIGNRVVMMKGVCSYSKTPLKSSQEDNDQYNRQILNSNHPAPLKREAPLQRRGRHSKQNNSWILKWIPACAGKTNECNKTLLSKSNNSLLTKIHYL
jgi:hypothetical protein